MIIQRDRRLVTASFGSLFHSVIVVGKKENLKISLCPFSGMCAAPSDLFSFNSHKSILEVFFSFVISDSSRPSPDSEARSALANCKHGLFHSRYFENGPLEPGHIFVGFSLKKKKRFYARRKRRLKI